MTSAKSQNKFLVAVVGSGPAGLSAAARAAESGLSHVVLESGQLFANTIQGYQKGKFVMDEPGYLNLRSPMDFEAGKRESILETWDNQIQKYNINIQYNAEVIKITGSKGNFELALRNGASIAAEYIVLATGLQGNLRKMEVEGADLPFVQYTLDDPDEYSGENIVVIGAGDAAIENAIALAENNRVSIVNRKSEFARAKQGNLNQILSAIETEQIQCFYNSNVAYLEADEKKPGSGFIVLKTDEGNTSVACDRVIARLGAIPPRGFLEACGINFPSADPKALPDLTAQYESNIPGLYIIGSLGGYPLIKQAMNQGYEVVEYIQGKHVKPADYEELEKRLSPLPYELDVDVCLKLFRDRIPMFTQLNPLLFRELVLESKVLTPGANEVIFQAGDYSTSFYTVVDGEVKLEGTRKSALTHSVGPGEFFGEMSLLSGRRRGNSAVAGEQCVLIETPRRTMVKLISSVDSVRAGLDEIYIARALQESFVPNATLDQLWTVIKSAKLHRFAEGDILFKENDKGEELHLIRKGSVALSREIDGEDVMLGDVRSGGYIGELSLMNVGGRTESAKAVVDTETIGLTREAFLELVSLDPDLVQLVQSNLRQRLGKDVDMEVDPKRGDVVDFLLKQGLGEATDVLIINDALCVGCDNCESACASTHGGVSRLDRKAGPGYAAVHVPTSCRHCENPHCMKDCPPNAINRMLSGEVFIDYETCIGCGNCVTYCPYGVIQLAVESERKPSLMSWLLFGMGVAPGKRTSKGEDLVKKAVKCDLCKDLAGGPACVRACPTGAAVRIGPDQFMGLTSKYG